MSLISTAVTGRSDSPSDSCATRSRSALRSLVPSPSTPPPSSLLRPTPARSPPTPALLHDSPAPPRSPLAQPDTRGSSPAGPLAPHTPAPLPPDISPHPQSGTTALLPPH